MTDFVKGQRVTFGKKWEGLYEGTHTVLEVIDVPPEEIEYNPITTEGGVGHHQWVVIKLNDEKHTFSGIFFEKDARTNMIDIQGWDGSMWRTLERVPNDPLFIRRAIEQYSNNWSKVRAIDEDGRLVDNS